jgi:hypothetical protein
LLLGWTAPAPVAAVARHELVLEGVNFGLTKPPCVRMTSAPSTMTSRRCCHGAMDIEVAGHTDSMGSDAYNMKLSQQRAGAVRNFLISKGVAADRLTAKGYGESQPVADNATREGRIQNRRVELVPLKYCVSAKQKTGTSVPVFVFGHDPFLLL